jgi:hypothetical protein
MKSCDLEQRRKDERAAFSARMNAFEASFGGSVHFYTNREADFSNFILLHMTLQQYSLLKPTKWIETVD